MSNVDKNRGKEYWRSLEELSDNPKYRKFLKEQYERSKSEADSSLSRRNFITLMGASIAFATMAGCRRPVEKIIPYVSQPEEIIPGVANYYATTMPFGNSAYGLIVECHEGRPTKIEGNPDHPSTIGAADVLIQASILSMYDPDRSRSVLENGDQKNYADFVSLWRTMYQKFENNKGEGLAILAEPYASPTISRLYGQIKGKFPKASIVHYEPISDENIFRAMENQTGSKLRPIYHYDMADIILSLDSDFLGSESEHLRASRGFADGRRMDTKDDTMNRLYVVEAAYSITGANADHRLRLQSSRIPRFLIALADKLKSKGLKLGNFPTASGDFDEKYISALADDLLRSQGKSIITAGRFQPVWVHEMVYAINLALGNIFSTIDLKKVGDGTSNRDQLDQLVNDINRDKIDTIVLFGGNPVYDAPSNLGFAESIKKIKNSIHISEHVNETSAQTNWHIPRTHYLESWGDASSADGTISIIQPMIQPLFGGQCDVEILNLLATGRDQRGYDIVRETWSEFLNKANFEKEWRRVLHDGYWADSKTDKSKPKIPNRPKNINPNNNSAARTDDLEIGFYQSNLYDGRFANNGWLQELPDSISKLAWDNAALLSLATARQFGLENGDVVNIELDSKNIETPVWIIPGQADGFIALSLGYGRTKAGKVGNGVGVNCYKLFGSSVNGYFLGAKISPTGSRLELANTQDHNRMEGRPIVREANLAEYREDPEFAREMVEHPPLKSMYEDYDYSKGYEWGMTIDLTSCIGCNACTIACQSENNIQIVGKEQVRNGRELHWMRLDRYFVGDTESPEVVHQPVTCQQCEMAPCETVCPVGATSHDKEGINTMSYNRCIGTRYCSNNCPYKVRRFNFFNYVNKLDEIEKMVQNPDVTVRSRGVMEKCTFCIQRITKAKRQAKREGRVVRDGEFQTACQQTCPTNAIQFGNINDPQSEVAKKQQYDRAYNLLSELNVRPRNSYLAKLRNPHPDLIEKEKKEEETLF